MLFKTENVCCPLETTQTVDIRVMDVSMDTDMEISTFSDKPVDSQETISIETMFTTVKLQSSIADPKSERSLSVRTPKRASKNIALISKHNASVSVNLEVVFSPAIIKIASLISSNKQPAFDLVIIPLGLINPQFTTDVVIQNSSMTSKQQTPVSRIPHPSHPQ